YPESADPADRILLPDYHGTEGLLAKVGGTTLHDAHDVVADRCGRNPLQPALGPRHLDNPERLRSRVVGAVDDCAERYGSSDVCLVVLDTLRGDCAGLGRHL